MNSVYEVVNFVNARMNLLASEIETLKRKNAELSTNEVGSKSSSPSSDVSKIVESHDKLLQELKVELQDFKKETKQILKQLADDVKTNKSTSDSAVVQQSATGIGAKERMLIETSIFTKCESHVNKLIKERIELSTSDIISNVTRLVDEKVQMVLDEKMASLLQQLQVSKQPLITAEHAHTNDITNQLTEEDISQQIESESKLNDDFDIDINPSQSLVPKKKSTKPKKIKE